MSLAPGGGDALVWKSADGTDKESVLASFPVSSGRAPLSWSRDGKYLVYRQSAGAGQTEDVMMLSVAGNRLAYVSDESGRFEICVQSLPRPGGRWQLSDGGVRPVWSTDGKALYYVNADGGTRERHRKFLRAVEAGHSRELASQTTP